MVLECVVTQGLPVLVTRAPSGSEWCCEASTLPGTGKLQIEDKSELSPCAAMPVVAGGLHCIFHPRLLKSIFQSSNLHEN